MVDVMNHHPSESELVARAKAGDREAFARLTQDLAPRVGALIRCRYPGALAHEGLDDLVQETLARACERFRRFEHRGDGSLFRWVASIALNVASKAARHGRRAAAALESEPAASTLTQSHALRREERLERLRSALETLPAEQREVLLLVRIDGLAVNEVAHRIGKTPNAVTKLILLASRALKHVFGDTESLGLPDRGLERGGTADER